MELYDITYISNLIKTYAECIQMNQADSKVKKRMSVVENNILKFGYSKYDLNRLAMFHINNICVDIETFEINRDKWTPEEATILSQIHG